MYITGSIDYISSTTTLEMPSFRNWNPILAACLWPCAVRNGSYGESVSPTCGIALMWAQRTQAHVFCHVLEPPPYRYVCSFTVGEGAVGRDQGATHTHVLSAKSMRSVCRSRNSLVPAVGGGGGVRLLSSKIPVPPVAHAGKTSIERM